MNDIPASKDSNTGPGEAIRFEAYKLEYQIAAARYDNIYRAIWQNFSYMAILAGGILTFGARALSMYWVGLLALAPLLFWFYATYIPMDHYAREARRRAADIEKILTTEFLGLQLHNGEVLPDATKEIRHFRDFGSDDPRLHWGKKEALRWRSLPPHVNQVVTLVGTVLTLTFVGLLVAALRFGSPAPGPQKFVLAPDGNVLRVQVEAQALKDLTSQLSHVTARLDSLQRGQLRSDTTMRTILRCLETRPNGRCP